MNNTIDKQELLLKLKTAKGIQDYLNYNMDVNIISKNIIKSGDLEVKVERKKR